MGRGGVKPALRLMTIVLSNGATLKMPTAAVRTKPFIATQDMYQHNVWTVKTKGAEAAAAGRIRVVDFSDFYKKFGVFDEEPEVSSSNANSASSGSTGSSSKKSGKGRSR